jgi:membrane-associated phospholipid phosphatase
MRAAEWVNFAYFSLLTLMALVWALPSRSKNKAILIGSAGLVVTAALSTANRWLPPHVASIFRDWLPAPLMAVAYWQSGCFFQKPNPAIQRIFEASDREILKLLRIDLPSLARTWMGTIFELAYVLCYPVVPLGVAALYLAGFKDRADEYWMSVLLSAYPSYVLLPFIQLLPPRLVEKTVQATEVTAGLRRFNLWLVRRVTHEANTFPSGHVAASAAIAMVLLRIAPAWGVLFAIIALGIAAGCIVGRYHYVVDVGAAFLLSAAVLAITAL